MQSLFENRFVVSILAIILIFGFFSYAHSITGTPVLEGSIQQVRPRIESPPQQTPPSPPPAASPQPPIQALGDDNDPCRSDRDCEQGIGLICRRKISESTKQFYGSPLCTTKKVWKRGVCEIDSQCQTGLLCVERTCDVPKKKEGEICSADGDCASNYCTFSCKSNKCQSLYTQKELDTFLAKEKKKCQQKPLPNTGDKIVHKPCVFRFDPAYAECWQGAQLTCSGGSQDKNGRCLFYAGAEGCYKNDQCINNRCSTNDGRTRGHCISEGRH